MVNQSKRYIHINVDTQKCTFANTNSHGHKNSHTIEKNWQVEIKFLRLSDTHQKRHNQKTQMHTIHTKIHIRIHKANRSNETNIDEWQESKSWDAISPRPTSKTANQNTQINKYKCIFDTNTRMHRYKAHHPNKTNIDEWQESKSEISKSVRPSRAHINNDRLYETTSSPCTCSRWDSIKSKTYKAALKLMHSKIEAEKGREVDRGKRRQSFCYSRLLRCVSASDNFILLGFIRMKGCEISSTLI